MFIGDSSKNTSGDFSKSSSNHSSKNSSKSFAGVRPPRSSSRIFQSNKNRRSFTFFYGSSGQFSWKFLQKFSQTFFSDFFPEVPLLILSKFPKNIQKFILKFLWELLWKFPLEFFASSHENSYRSKKKRQLHHPRPRGLCRLLKVSPEIFRHYLREFQKYLL